MEQLPENLSQHCEVTQPLVQGPRGGTRRPEALDTLQTHLQPLICPDSLSGVRNENAKIILWITKYNIHSASG